MIGRAAGTGKGVVSRRFAPVVGRRDALVVAGFLLYAAVFQLGRWRGFTPFVFLGGDAANIAGYAAALDHPQLFAGDSALGDPEELSFYATIHIPLLRALFPLFGDYGTAYVSLLGIHVLLQALGFYVLGRVLFENRFWALLLSVVTLMPVWVGLGTLWGTYEDPVPRFTFQALLPFVLSLALVWSSRPSRWPALMGIAGLLMYVHPVSAPSWAVALWLGLAAERSETLPLRRRLAVLALAAAVFLLVSAPFLAIYLGSREHVVPQASSAISHYAILRQALPSAYFDASLAVRTLVVKWGNAFALVWLWAAVGAVVVWRLGGRERTLLARMGLWAVGIVLVSVGVSWLDQWQASVRHALPVQFDLIRGLRYLVPLLLICAILPLAALHARLTRSLEDQRRRRAAVLAIMLAGVAFVAVWTLRHQPPEIRTALSCWRSGRFPCPRPAWPPLVEMLEAVQTHTSEGEVLHAPRVAWPVRYYALRPVAHDRRDIGVFLYSKPEALPRWQETIRRSNAIGRIEDPRARFHAQLELAASLGAEAAVFVPHMIPRKHLAVGDRYEGCEILWLNARYVLVRLLDDSPRGAPAPSAG